MVRDEDHWDKQAACFGKDTEMFFPPRRRGEYKAVAAKAKALCFGEEGKPACPVRLECLWAAVDGDEQHGIWGGMSHRERNALFRKWKKNYATEMTLQQYIMQLEGAPSWRQPVPA